MDGWNQLFLIKSLSSDYDPMGKTRRGAAPLAHKETKKKFK